MCFSAAADFAAAAAIGAVGVATLACVRQPRAIPFAAIPALFAVHHLVEGFVWLGLDGRLDAAATRAAVVAFMVYAQGALPLVIPLAVLLIEPSPQRRWGMLALGIVGAGLAAFVAHGLFSAPSTAVIQGRCIAYRNPVTNHPWVAFLYAAPTCGAPLLSSHRVARAFGALSLLGMTAVLAVKAYALTSVWCLWAAGLSVMIYAHFRRGALAGAGRRRAPARA